MGDKFQEFRLRTSPRNKARIFISLAYLVWAFAFIFLGLQPATTDAASGDPLVIPSIHLDTTTEPVSIVDHKFTVPDYSVGAYYITENKTFLMGHKATIFSNLKNIAPKDEITFANQTYFVSNIEVKKKEDIDMGAILSPSPTPTLVLMTCHGTPLSATDYSHRLIVTATHP